MVAPRRHLLAARADRPWHLARHPSRKTLSNRYRSFFWPAVLILVGVLALLVNTGQIAIDRLLQLADLWPVILVVIGLEIIIRRSLHGPTGEVAAALVVLLAIVGAAAYVLVAPNPSATSSFEASGDVGTFTAAQLEIDAGAATIVIADSGDLGSRLYHARIDYSGPKPEVRLDPSGKLQISQANNTFGVFQSRRFVLHLDLNPSVGWTIAVNSGAATATINVPHVHVTALALNTGASRDDITLGPPSGMVPVKIDGGALTVNVHRPSGTKASIDVSGGAVSLDADGHAFHAIGKAGYQTGDLGSDAYRIEVNGGACTVTLDTTAPSG